MGRWMQQVGAPQENENAPDANPPKLTEPGFVGSVSAPAGHRKDSDPVLSVLSVPHAPLPEKFTAPDDPAEIVERAALMEDGGLPRAWADGLARLALMPPPEGWGRDWRTVRDGILRFADRLAADPWVTKAHRLGWTAVDLFGVDPAALAARLDCRGAATFVGDAEICLITADAIVVGTRSGARMRITKPTSSGGVPLWSLAA